MSALQILIYIAVMAGVTYLVRLLPLVLFRKKIKSTFVKSFLYYIPYAVLGAMTFPAILTATGSVIAAAIGLVVGVVMAFFEKSLITVAVASCAAVFVVQMGMQILGAAFCV